MRLCWFHGLVKSKQLYPIAAQKLNFFRLIQGYVWRTLQRWICGTHWEIFSTLKLEVQAHSSNTNTRTSIWRHRVRTSERAIIQHAIGIKHFRRQRSWIKQMKKGRSPTMRHISRTHSVDLDWLHGRINHDPMILIKYVNTTQQLANSLTKWSFTGDKCTQLTLLVNIMTHTTVTQSNLSVSSAIVNLLYPAWSNVWIIVRCICKREPWTITQYLHQITKLEATPSKKNCARKDFNNSLQRRPEHHQAPGDSGGGNLFTLRRTLMENNTSENSMIQ